MKHAQIVKVYNEIKQHKSKLRKQEQEQFKKAENTIRNDYNNFYQKYPKLVNRILNNNLDKLINKIVKIHKNKNGNYNNFSRNYPELYSPNVLMRPLYQESILPNLAYIGGSAEIAYWMQLKDAFDEENIPFPLLFLRNSVLILDQKQLKIGLYCVFGSY